MKIFIDFDDVVFNTKQFIADRDEIIKKHGVSSDIYINKYNRDKTESKSITYNYEEHIESLKKASNGNFEKLKNELTELIKNSKNYIFDGFLEFAEKIGKENLYLVSYGEIGFQKAKIENSDIKKYFANIIITDRHKSDVLPENLIKDKDEKYYFIDDRIKNLQNIKEAFPEFTTLLMLSENGRYKDELKDNPESKNLEKYCDKKIKNFKEIEEFLESRGELTREYHLELEKMFN